MFSAKDYAVLAPIVFAQDYPGFPQGLEVPNGDGNVDEKKLYSHVSHHYIGLMRERKNRVAFVHGNAEANVIERRIQTINDYLNRAHEKSIEIAVHMGIPRKYWPSIKFSALRVLEYAPDAGSHEHTDFDLFTLSCYRNEPRFFCYSDDRLTIQQKNSLVRAQMLNEQIHFGEIMEIINPTLYKANGHYVSESNSIIQYSIVYFAVPDHDEKLPSGMTVGKWIEERKSRSRVMK